MLRLGVVTYVGFWLQVEVDLRQFHLLVATIIQSSTVILIIIWGVLFYGDVVTWYVICGSAMFLIGILFVNLRGRRGKSGLNVIFKHDII